MWQGDKTNPVPDQKNVNSFGEKIINNSALNISRNTDKVKNFTVSIKNIDECVMGHLQKMQLTIVDNGNNIKVPINYASPEKWKSVRNDGFMRDNNGKIILPALVFYRSGMEMDQTMVMFNKYLRYSVLKRYSQKNQYTPFSALMGKNAPINEVYNVVMPDHMNFNYKFIVWTEYIEQNNALIERINFETNDYWGDKNGFRFRTAVNSYANTSEVQSDQDRLIKTEFDLTLRGYLLPELFSSGLGGFKSTTEKSFTAKKIIFSTEIVSNNWNPEKNPTNENKWRNKTFPNLVLGKEPPSTPVDISN